MKRNKKGNSPIFMYELDDFDIKEIVCSTITMFSVFSWDSIYKEPKNDKKLNAMLEKLQSYIIKNYKEE